MNVCVKRIALLYVVVALSACSPKNETLPEASSGLSESDSTFVADTNEYLSRLERLGFAGNFRITRGDQVLLNTGIGLADREAGKAWSDDTVGTVGSITKQFTGAAILLLQEDGLLNVDDPITDYFTDVPADKQTIMLHQLLTHSSGIVDLNGPGDWDPIGRDEFIRRAMEQELEFEPGSSFAYSNAGYSLLAAIIEQITGGSYETFIRERLFLPAGMKDTGYIQANWDVARMASGYQGEERWGTVLERPLGEDGPYWVLRGNGGIHSTTADMVRWADALESGAILSPESMQAFWAPHVDEGFGDSFYSYGWVTMQGPGDQRMITHNGGNGIVFADFAIFPDAGVTIILQTNVVYDWPLAEGLLGIITERLFNENAYPSVPDVVAVSEEGLQSYPGRYVSGEGESELAVDVAIDGNELSVTPANARTFALMHSTRVVDDERSARLTNRINEVVAAYVENDDLRPLFDAYRGVAPLEVLEDGWRSRKEAQEAEFGALTGYVILGTALRDGRDVTVARHLFENGHSDTAFVWDPEETEHLLGRSARGLDPKLRFLATGDAVFGSWDGGFSDSRPLRFEDENRSLIFADAKFVPSAL